MFVNRKHGVGPTEPPSVLKAALLTQLDLSLMVHGSQCSCEVCSTKQSKRMREIKRKV